MGWFDNLMQRQFRKMVRKILITNVPDFEKKESKRDAPFYCRDSL